MSLTGIRTDRCGRWWDLPLSYRTRAGKTWTRERWILCSVLDPAQSGRFYGLGFGVVSGVAFGFRPGHSAA